VRPHRSLTAVAATLAVGAAGLVLVTTPAEAAPDRRCVRTNDTVAKLTQCVTLEGVLEHEQAFQDIADDHGGTRASGSSGYDASLAYVQNRLDAVGYSTSRQAFTFHKFTDLGGSILQQTAPATVDYIRGTDFIATPHSEPGDVTASVTAVDINLTLPRANTSGCESDDFLGFPAGNIALIQRGTCTFMQKGNNASAAGASGIVFFNQGNDESNPERMGIPAVTLGDGYTGSIPALSVPYELGATLAGLVGSGLQLRLKADVTRVLTTTNNLIAELGGGDPQNVVMAGAHLDSVPAGPGINDNGSGSSALLEVAENMAKLKNKLPNKVRLAWWGAEEDGLVGSTFYVNSLTEAQQTDIELYLNFDMIASPNYGLFIYDGDGSGFGLSGPPGSDDIEHLFEAFFASRGVPSEPTAFTGRSDYQRFIQVGIPAGGLFTGAEVLKTAAQVAKWGGTAGVAYDHCYHSACDTIANVNHTALDINSDAMATAILSYAAGYAALTP
jgi:Zn-dependent M28 family amino/carboxypeptidase